MSIIVTIISNITVLQFYLLWIFVSIRRFPQLIISIGVLTPHQKHQPLLFCQVPLLNLKTIQYPPFRHFTPNILGFHASPPPENRIFQWTPIILKLWQKEKFLFINFLPLNISDINLFFMQKLRPLVCQLSDKKYFIYQLSFALMNNAF